MVASETSSFGLAEVRRNLIAAAGGLFRLPRAIGQAAAMDAILTGKPISAPRAHEFGLVSRLTKPGRARALAAPTKTDDELISMTNAAFARVIAAEDTKEGLAAFIEKRAPKWQAR